MKKRLLIVDDTESILASLSMLFSDKYEITIARSGNEALDLMQEKTFHCVMCDYYMENGDGLSVLRQNKSVPTIIMTGHGKKELFLEFANNHAYQIIEKPLKPHIVEPAVEKAMDFHEEKLRRDTLIRAGEQAAKVIHDINNPLSVMMLAVEATKESEAEAPPHHDKFVRRVERGIEMLRNTIDSFKEASETQGRHFCVASMIRDMVESYRVMFEKEKVTLSLSIPDSAVAHSSPLRFRRALENLTKNAIDAMKSQADKKLEIIVSTEGSMIRVFISDSGPGISEEVKTKLFTKGVTTKGAHGTGLGLWGSKDNLNKVGAELSLKNTTSKGCVFEITMPKERGGKV